VGAAATLRLSTRGRTREFRGRAIVDDTVGYHARHTHWWWSAGAGRAASGAAVAWNLVSGINDAQSASERTVWVDGEPFEPPPSRFAADLTAVDGLTFHTEAQLSRRARLGPIRSDYHQPFGTFSGHLPGGLELAHGLGVMEEHDVWW
jgi:hypothetical protein